MEGALLQDLGDLEHDLVGEGDAQLAGGLQVDHEVERHRLLDGEIGGLGAFQNLVYINSRAPIEVIEVRP